MEADIEDLIRNEAQLSDEALENLSMLKLRVHWCAETASRALDARKSVQDALKLAETERYRLEDAVNELTLQLAHSAAPQDGIAMQSSRELSMVRQDLEKVYETDRVHLQQLEMQVGALQKDNFAQRRLVQSERSAKEAMNESIERLKADYKALESFSTRQEAVLVEFTTRQASVVSEKCNAMTQLMKTLSERMDTAVDSIRAKNAEISQNKRTIAELQAQLSTAREECADIEGKYQKLNIEHRRDEGDETSFENQLVELQDKHGQYMTHVSKRLTQMASSQKIGMQCCAILNEIKPEYDKK